MKVSLDLVLMDAEGKKILSRWKDAACDPEGRVFMTTFDEEIFINRGDVLIGEMHFDSSSPGE